MAADEATNDIHAVDLTTNAVSDGKLVETLLAAIEQPITKLGGDGAYDQVKVYDELVSRHIQPIIPPRASAVIWTNEAGNILIHSRNEALMKTEAVGLAEWKHQSGYHHGPPLRS